MLPIQFFGQNAHFAISLFAALVFFAVFWLYFDAWLSETPKPTKDVYKWAGFLLVSVSFIIHATLIEQSDLAKSAFGSTGEVFSAILRLLGYAGIIIGQVVDPLQKKPETKGIEAEFTEQPDSPKATPAVAGSGAFGAAYLLPLGALAIAALYWRRASRGLERHLRPVALAFLLLFGFELSSLAGLARGTSNPDLYNLVKAFGPLWMLSQAVLLLGVIVLGRWVWRYLTERFMSQLFMILTSSALVIFLLTTVSFTYLLTRNVRNDTLDNLAAASNVLGYALDSKKAETKANAEAVAANPQIAQAVLSHDHKSLANLTASFLQDKKESSLVITTSSAQVLLRAENPDRWGDSISGDSLTRRALVGEASSTVDSSQGVLAPVISIKSTVPIRQGDSIVGTVSTAVIADNGFVDGIKHSTGLESAIYAGNSLSATTFTAPDGKSRQIGVKQTSQTINNQVLVQGHTYKGSLDILNRPFLAVYTPLKDVNNNVVGMLFIGQPQSSVLKTAAHSIELTFIVAVSLMVLAILPAYWMSRYIARQLE
jgi:hypothetical protein